MLVKIPINFDDDGFLELVQALEECPSVNDIDNLNEIIDLLNNDIKIKIERSKNIRRLIRNILKTFGGFPDKFDSFIDAINFYEQDSAYYLNLLQIVKTIAEQQQVSSIELTKGPNIFEEIEFDLEKGSELFENLWSELCLILEGIDWKNIWNACSQIFTKNKVNTAVTPKELKSLCFTKNYDKLKPIFLNTGDRLLAIKNFGELLEPYDININLWLDKVIREMEQSGANVELNKEKKDSSPPILLIIVDKGDNGENQNKWNVRGQLKYQGKQSAIQLSSKTIKETCAQFEDIPGVIKKYIDVLEEDYGFRSSKINKLRIEIFLPLTELNRNIDDWVISSREEPEKKLVVNYRLFVRIIERARKNGRICSLVEGWKKLDDFVKTNCSEISKASVTEIIKEPKKAHLLEILETFKVSSWIELAIYMEECQKLWGLNWKSPLPKDRNKRIEFFTSICNSGIPIAFWNWHSIPQDVPFDKEHKKIFCLSCLRNRCHQLLETTWTMRRLAWCHSNEEEREKRPGYYLGMLVEDPEILPEPEHKLEIILAKQ